MENLTCPYCGHEIRIDSEDIGEDGELFERECPECEKIFVYRTIISYSFLEKRADCLNGSPHEYEMTNTYPVEFTVWRCKTCGHVKALLDDEMEKLIADSKK